MSNINTYNQKFEHWYKQRTSIILAKCTIRMYRRGSHAPHWIVIASERPDNEGVSITNAAEELATEIASKFEIEAGRMIWIEHYPDTGGGVNNQFDLVSFTISGDLPSEYHYNFPSWQRISTETVIGLTKDANVEGGWI